MAGAWYTCQGRVRIWTRSRCFPRRKTNIFVNQDDLEDLLFLSLPFDPSLLVALGSSGILWSIPNRNLSLIEQHLSETRGEDREWVWSVSGGRFTGIHIGSRTRRESRTRTRTRSRRTTRIRRRTRTNSQIQLVIRN